jgi:hypothetical protein
MKTFSRRPNNNSVVEEPAMVMGFLPAKLHQKLRCMAAEFGCSENLLVSKFVREALLSHTPEVQRELQ